MSPSWGFVALIGGATTISLGVIAVKQGYAEGSDPQSIMAARLLVAAPLLVLALPLVMRGRRISAGAIAVGLAAGVLIWTANRAELEGLVLLPAGTLVLLLTTAPIWVALIGWIAMRRVPTAIDRFAIAAVVLGVAIMAAPIGASVDALGILFGLLSAISFALFLFVLERNQQLSAVLGFVLGVIGAALVVVASEPAAVTDISGGLSLWLIAAIGLSTAGWAILVGLGVGSTSSVTAAIVVGVEPLLVAVLAYLILGEGLSAREIVGGAVVVAALTAVGIEIGRDEARSRRPA